MRKTKHYFYRFFGLRVRSEFYLPEGFLINGEKFEISIVIDSISETQKKSIGRDGIRKINSNDFLVRIPNVAFFWVQGGRQITVDRINNNDDTALRLFLLGPIFNLLLNQRGALLLHASCVGRRNECLVIAGQSGAGKSTLAAAFMDYPGFKLLSDDISLISFSSDGCPLVHPALPRIKIMSDALKLLNISNEGAEKLTRESNKYNFLLHSSFQDTPLNLKAIFVLKEMDIAKVEIRRLVGKDKISSILENSYWIDDRFDIGDRDKDFIQATKMATYSETFLICYNKQFHHPSTIASAVRRKFKEI